MLFELYCIINNISTPRRVFCNKFLPRQQEETAEKAVPCCTLVILGIQTIGFLFWKVIGFILLILGASVCIIYKIWLSAINIVAYLFSSTICFNRGRLTWNSIASFTTIKKYTRSTPRLKREIYMSSNARISSHCVKWTAHLCITSHNPLWRGMVYRRIMTAAFLWSLQYFSSPWAPWLCMSYFWTMNFGMKLSLEIVNSMNWFKTFYVSTLYLTVLLSYNGWICLS